MGRVTLDHQEISQICDCCGQEFIVSRGSLYKQGQGIGIYLVALHSCNPEKVARLAIAIREGYEESPEICAVAVNIWSAETEIQMSVTNAAQSPWRDESYLGRIMDRDEALDSSLINTFFHLAEHIVAENPAVSVYLME